MTAYHSLMSLTVVILLFIKDQGVSPLEEYTNNRFLSF